MTRTTITRDKARALAACYISPFERDENVTGFATSGHVWNPSGLIAELRRELVEARRGTAYQHEPMARVELARMLQWAVAEYGRYTVTVYTTVLGPWEQDENGNPIGDERPEIDTEEETLQFHYVSEAVEWLSREGFGVASVHPGPYDDRTWLSLVDSPRSHGSDGDYTGVVEEKSAHMGPGFTVPCWAGVVDVLCRPQGKS